MPSVSSSSLGNNNSNHNHAEHPDPVFDSPTSSSTDYHVAFPSGVRQPIRSPQPVPLDAFDNNNNTIERNITIDRVSSSRISNTEEEASNSDEDEQSSTSSSSENDHRPINLASKEGIRLPSGTVIAPRQARSSTTKRRHINRTKAAPLRMHPLPPAPSEPSQAAARTSHPNPPSTPSTPLPGSALSMHVRSQAAAISSHRQLARRDEMAIRGISEQGRRAIFMAEKKAQRCEAVTGGKGAWATARNGNKQEFDQIDIAKGKWGKQNHKLLPR